MLIVCISVKTVKLHFRNIGKLVELIISFHTKSKHLLIELVDEIFLYVRNIHSLCYRKKSGNEKIT